MELNLPVFELRVLKKHFYTFLVVSILCAFLTIVIRMFVPVQLPEAIAKAVKSWGVFALIFALTYLYGRLQKRALQKILNAEDVDRTFTLYERYYKNKLLWGIVSQILLDTFWLITHSRFLFYFILAQLLLTILLYPSRRIITKELKDMEIAFI